MISPHKRQVLIRAIHAERDWTGRISGFRTQVSITGPNLVQWRVCIRRQWHAGEALDCFHALEAVDVEIARDRV